MSPAPSSGEVCSNSLPVMAHYPAILSGAALEGQEPGSFPSAGVPFKTHMMGTGFIGLLRDRKVPGCHSADSEGHSPTPGLPKRAWGRATDIVDIGVQGCHISPWPCRAELQHSQAQPDDGWLSPAHWQGSCLCPLQLPLPRAWTVTRCPPCLIQLQLKSLQAGWSFSSRKQCS